VKIRGFRVEPGEVEAALAAHPGVREAAVVAREDAPGDRRLVAYVVSLDGAIDGEALRAHLRRRLPEHMVPSAFVSLAALPVTPNGKVDRRALPAPAEVREGRARYVAPRTPTEELLAGAWAEVLGVERVGVEDDAFALGAHSLAAMRVASRVREALGVELPLAAIFDHPTVAALAPVADAHARRAPEFPPIVPAPRAGRIPPGFQQESVWFLQQLTPGSRSYHFQATLGFRGPLDVDVLERALGEIVRRHELLRTTFPTDEGGPVQRIHAPWPVFLPLADFSRRPAEERDAEVRRWLESQFEAPFALSRLPLIRWSLLRLADDHHLLVQVEHHVVHDGWSLHLLLGELTALYRAFAAGEPSPLPELEVQFADHVVWHRRWMEGDAARAQLDFWRGRLAGSPPALELPADHPRPAVPSLRGAAPRFHLSAELYGRLHAVSRREGATLFMTMMAAFQAVLARWSGRTDVSVGTAVAARRQKETERLIGMFVNMVVVRADAGGGPTFRELLARVRRATLDAYAHQDVPFDAVVAAVRPEREPGRNPLFQVSFSFHDSALPDLAIPGLELELTVALPNGSAKFDLNVIVIPHAEQRLGRGGEGDGGMTVVWEHSTDLFEPATARRMFEEYRRVLEAVAEDPGVPLSALPPSASAPRRDTIAALFAEAARRAPDAAAVIAEDGRLTYGELDARANRLARVLRARGVGPEARVGLCLERGTDLVVAVLAVVKTGGAYLSLDPSYPPERLAYLVRDGAVRLVLARPEFVGRVPAGAADVLPLDAALAEAAGEDGSPLESGAEPDTVACVLYTSGSTGQPKGVMVTHRGIVRLVRDAAYADYGAGQVFLGIAPLAFDASTLELWAPLLNGSAVALFPPHAPTLEELGAFIRARAVTIGWITAGLFRQMVDEDPGAFAGMRQVMTGGEVVGADHLRRVLRANPGLVVIHGYGPTEVTTFTTAHPLRSEAEVADPVPLGAPIAETSVHVLDAALRPVADGTEGELFAGGGGVARGYQGRPGLTAEKFVPDPFSPSPGARLYRSGDRVRRLADGTLYFVGRVDGQVKIRGFRIEPGEVEAALARHPAIRTAVVAAREDRPGDRRLVAYFVAGGALPTVAELRAHLKALLPEHMVPSAYVPLAALPLNANGKVDRRALPPPDAAQPPAVVTPAAESPVVAKDAGAYRPPRTPTEEVLAAIWAEVLEIDRAGVGDGFLALGGDAPLAAQVVARLWQTLEVRLSAEAVLQAETLADFALSVDGARGAPPAGAAGPSVGGPSIVRLARGPRSLESLRGEIEVRPAAVRIDEDAEHVEPRTATERRLVEIWVEVLERPRISVDDDFFLLGGHSLLATLILSRVRQAFAVQLPLRALFDGRSVAGLAARIDAAREDVPAGSAGR
jgi:amino acid adenylation domain-containing protein